MRRPLGSFAAHREAIGRELAAERERRGLPLPRAAREIGISKSALFNTEQGFTNPTIELLWRVATFYGVDLSTLFGRIERRS